MKYLIAIVIVVFLSFIYFISYRLNNKVKIECDKETCLGCQISGCIHYQEGKGK